MKSTIACISILTFLSCKPVVDDPVDHTPSSGGATGSGGSISTGGSVVEVTDASSDVIVGSTNDSAADAGNTDSGIKPFIPSIYGSTVTFSVHCCSAPVSDTNLISKELSAVVGPQVEFPAITNSSNGTRGVIDADVDIQPSKISIAYNGAFNTAAGTFNGYVFTFDTSNLPEHLYVDFAEINGNESTIDPSTAYVTISPEGDTVYVNAAGLHEPANTIITINLSLGLFPPMNIGYCCGIRG